MTDPMTQANIDLEELRKLNGRFIHNFVTNDVRGHDATGPSNEQVGTPDQRTDTRCHEQLPLGRHHRLPVSQWGAGSAVRSIARFISSLGLFLVTAAAMAQGYPAKPIRLLVPFPPGGSSDLVARSYASRLGELLGQPVVVDYKGGAGGSIGAADVARATPDGYTLLQVWDTHAVNHHVYKVQYDFSKSFAPVSLLVQSPGILVAHPSFPPSSVAELIEYSKANPDKATYASAGTGSSNHVSGLLFSRLTGVKMTHVPYKGGGPLMTDLLGGHVNMVFGTLPLYEEHVRSGKLKVIATLAKARIPQFPDVPAAAETVPGFEAKTWFGLFAPAGTPADVIARLHREVVASLNDAKVKEGLRARGFDITASTPEVFAAFLKLESDISGGLVREAGIKPE
jgi:tripartite-type tricarboxylate transporter receptor subunit TctC